MGSARKITLYVPDDLLRRAQDATGEGITPTVRRALELMAASRAYEKLRRLKGRVRLTLDTEELRKDRR